MIEKRGISPKVYAIIVIPIMLLAYYFSGIFTFEDVSLNNFTDKLVLVFKEFYMPWKWANEKTIACLGVGLILWVFVCSYLSYNYRNYHSGKEYGSEDWADPFEVTKRRQEPVPEDNRILSYNARIAKNGDGKPSNNNMLVIGSSGTYKTTSIVTPNILQATSNFIVLDVKGELMYKYGLYLQSKGYTIRCLNLKHPEQSLCYNPYAYVETEDDVIKLIENIYDALTPSKDVANDPFWIDGPKLFLQALFFCEWEKAKNENRQPEMNNVFALLEAENQIDDTKKVSGKGSKEKPPTKLQTIMNELAKVNPESPAARDYQKFKNGAEETVRSITIIINSKLKLCQTQSLRRIFEKDEMGLRDFAYGVGGTPQKQTMNKLAVFLCVDDRDQSYNFVCSMLYSQALTIMSRIADDFYRGGLPISLEFWMDEFYAGARPSGVESVLGVCRSRNISLIPILQSLAQIKDIYGGDKWNIIMDNCATLIFLGSGAGATDTHEWVSNLLGDMTIDASNDSRSGSGMSGQGSEQHSRLGRKLMTPQEVRRMDRKHCIIFMEGERPIYDYKALPWDMHGATAKDIKRAEKLKLKNADVSIPSRYSNFEVAMQLNKKHPDNGFVIKNRTFIDAHNGSLHTKCEAPLQEVDAGAIPEDAVVIDVTSDEFLRMDLNMLESGYKSASELDAAVKTAMSKK